MPDKIEAYKTKDGIIFEDAERAAEYEGKCALRDFLTRTTTPGGSDNEWVAFIVDNAGLIHAALDPIIQSRKPPVTRRA